MRRPSRNGLTLVEVLVAVVVMGLLLVMVTLFFSQQRRHSAQVEADAQVRAQARTIGELVAQDLELTGATAVVDATTHEPSYESIRVGAEPSEPSAFCTVAHTQGCIVQQDPPPTTAVNASVWYTLWYRTSTDAAAPCHRVDYAWDGRAKALYRFDEGRASCADLTPSGSISLPADLSNAVLAREVTEFSLSFDCDDPTVDAGGRPKACYDNGSFVRSANVHVEVTFGGGTTPAVSDFDLEAPMPNLRYSESAGTGP